MIRYYTDLAMHTSIRVNQMTFPGGEVKVDVNFSGDYSSEWKVKKIWIDARITSSDDFMALLMTVDALRRAYPSVTDIGLFLPYFPYARQDRVCNDGESLSVAVAAKLINSCGFSYVNILDPHSAVTPALIDNVCVGDQWEVFGEVKDSFREIYIVAPDAGAVKKCEDFAKKVGAAGVIVCHKTRELATGKITGMSCDQDVTGLNLFVLDDICDGGRTFIELAQMFGDKPLTLELAVTHGIFSKGVEVVLAEYDHVYTTDSFHEHLNRAQWEGLTVIHVD